MASSPNKRRRELFHILDQLVTVLENDGDAHWNAWMRKAQTPLVGSDYAGITYLLSAYGGMSSFNDVVLGRRYDKGVFSWEPGHLALNEKIDKLRNEAAQLAEEIQGLQGG